MVMQQSTVRLFSLFCLFVSLVLCDSSPCAATEINGLSVGNNVTYYGNLDNAPVFENECVDQKPIAWFTFTPSEMSIVTATTCGPNTKFDTLLNLMGGDCSDLECISENDDDWSCEIADNTSLLQFPSIGKKVYIGVSAYYDDDEYQRDYEITFSEEEAPNRPCRFAQPLHGPFTTPLVIVNSTKKGIQSSFSSCGLPAETNQFWFTLQTDSAVPLIITTCNDNTNFDTVISLLSGDCTNLECVDYNDDNCTSSGTGASTLHLTPIPNFLYFLVVSGFNSSTSGTFGLYIAEQGFAQSGCLSAFTVNLDRTQTIQGSTIGGSLLKPPAICNIEQGNSMWYSIFTPTGTKSTTFSICNNYTNFNASMSIYSDSCSNPMCVISTNGCTTNGSELTLNLNANEYVYLVVASADGSAGSFEIYVNSQ